MTAFDVFVLWALVSAIITLREWRVDPPTTRLVAHCPRCDEMREFGHRCPDAEVSVDR